MKMGAFVRNLGLITACVCAIDPLAARAQSRDAADSYRRTDAAAVLLWNRIATEILPVEAGPIIDSRAMAILHAAIHDAVNGIERRYEPYAADLASPHASLAAAVA